MAKLLRTASRVEELERNLSEARTQLRLDLAAARASGESISELARRLGVTRARIYQLLK
jgi:DNA-binding MarR family transcriptional regulator